MNLQGLLRHTLIYRYIWHPYRMRQVKESRMRKYEQLKENAPALLKIIVDIFNKEKISYWLEFGSLLGAYRDKSIIKGDFDFDFGVYQKDVAKIYTAFTEAGFRLVREFHVVGNNELEQTYYNGEILFDIFYFSEKEDDSLICFGFTPIPNRNSDKPTFGKVHSWTFNKFDLMEYEFLGTTVMIPTNTEEHLEETYGKGWKTPDPSFTKGLNRYDYSSSECRAIGFQYM